MTGKQYINKKFIYFYFVLSCDGNGDYASKFLALFLLLYKCFEFLICTILYFKKDLYYRKNLKKRQPN